MRGARSLLHAAGVLSNLRRGGEKAYAAHCICAVHYGKWQLKWVCAIKNFYGAGRVFINNMRRAGMRIIMWICPLRILLIFKKKFFP